MEYLYILIIVVLIILTYLLFNLKASKKQRDRDDKINWHFCHAASLDSNKFDNLSDTSYGQFSVNIDSREFVNTPI